MLCERDREKRRQHKMLQGNNEQERWEPGEGKVKAKDEATCGAAATDTPAYRGPAGKGKVSQK